MTNPLATMSYAERTAAVCAFSERFGEMEKVLWLLSQSCRSTLLDGTSSPVLEALVWTVKSWWGVQGVSSAAKALMAEAVAVTVRWSPDLFQEAPAMDPGAADQAYELVAAIVDASRAMGVPRREFSLTSKVLHWLLPWRVPVYDSYVRRVVGIPGSWDHPYAYRRVAHEVFGLADAAGSDLGWVGSLEPLSALRALDKCLWWIGGGDQGSAAQVNDPWHIVHQLGLERI